MRPQGATAGFAPWTASEDKALRHAYVAGGIYVAHAHLPHRSVPSLFHRARRIGLYRRRRWTAADDAQLRNLWGVDMSLDEIAERLGRTPITTYWRAQKIGLPLGCPDGWERLSHAAERTGYCTSQLRRILKAAGVEMRRSITRETKPRGKRRKAHRWHIVVPESVDAAIKRWLATEPVSAAARRHGVTADVLARRLRLAGIKKTVAGKKHWRVSEVDVADALYGPAPRLLPAKRNR